MALPSPRLLLFLLPGIGGLAACHGTGLLTRPPAPPRVPGPKLTLLGDSLPRPWLRTAADTAYLDYGKARTDFFAVHGCVQLCLQGDSAVARWYAYTDTASGVGISVAGLRAFYAARRHHWRRRRRVAAPRARVLDPLNAYVTHLPAYRSLSLSTAVDTYLLTTAGRPEATLVIDHSAQLNAHQRVLALFQP